MLRLRAALPGTVVLGTPDSRAESRQNVRLVGYHDLQGWQSLVVTTKSDPANGNWVDVGHTPNDRADPQASDDGQGIRGRSRWSTTTASARSRKGTTT